VSTSPLGVAIIGCGHMGTVHARTIAHDERARLVALVDPRVEAAERLRGQIDVPAERVRVSAAAEEALADPAVSAVVIATHHDVHPVLAIAAARAGKHIFCEKPLGLTNDACQQIANAVRAAGVQLVVGFQARHAALVRLAAERLPAPRILFGQIIDPRWGDRHWAVDPLEGGGNVLSQGVHTFDLLCHFAGAEPEAVFAGGGTLTHDPALTAVVDSVAATIRFANGAAASLLIGDFGPSPWTGKSYYELFDARGQSATISGYYERVRFAKDEPLEVSKDDLPEPQRADYQGYGALMREFIGCALANRPPAIAAGVAAGVRATALALACFESIASGNVVRLKA
jgi:predicted dehydrogenase